MLLPDIKANLSLEPIAHKISIFDKLHVGLLPQSYNLSSGYRIQGKTQLEAEKILADAIAVQDSGAFAVVLEGIPANLAEKITKKLDIPTIGIGAGPHCDGQIQVYHDIMGLYGEMIPKHCKRYGDLRYQIQKMLMEYKEDVEANKFPSQEHYTTNQAHLENTHK